MSECLKNTWFITALLIFLLLITGFVIYGLVISIREKSADSIWIVIMAVLSLAFTISLVYALYNAIQQHCK